MRCSILVFIAIGVLAVWIRSQAILDEVHLLVECHGDPTHQARKLTDLRKKYDELKVEYARLTEERNLCLLDKDTELSHVKTTEMNSYWAGFNTAMWLVITISVVVSGSLLYLQHRMYTHLAQRERHHQAGIQLQHMQHPAHQHHLHNQPIHHQVAW